MITKEQALEALDVLKGYAPVWVEDKANTVQNYIEQSHPAPDLVEALEAVLECGSVNDQVWVDDARAALAKAYDRGEK